jgi:hypothetical protein
LASQRSGSIRHEHVAADEDFVTAAIGLVDRIICLALDGEPHGGQTEASTRPSAWTRHEGGGRAVRKNDGIAPAHR